MKKITIAEVVAQFPEVSMLQNKEWARKVCEIWKEVFENCKWDNISEAWFNPVTPGVKLVSHIRANTQGAVALADVHKRLFNVDVDRDVLIATCLLHDVCKLLEYEPCKEGAKKSSIGKTYQHGFLSAYYAQRAGFPESVVSIIISHTGESRAIPRSLEGIIMYYADVVDADFHRVIAGSPLLIDKYK